MGESCSPGHPALGRAAGCCESPLLCRLQNNGSETCTVDIPRRGLNDSGHMPVRNPKKLPTSLAVLQRTTLPGYKPWLAALPSADRITPVLSHELC